MKLVVAKCPACGATVEVNPNEHTIRCEYCNSSILVEDKIKDITKLNTYLKLAERHYHDKEYKEAYTMYQKVIELDIDNYIAVLRKGISKSLCTNYQNFEINYAINGMKNCYTIIKNNKQNNKEASLIINNCILECCGKIVELELLAMHFYENNKLTLEMNEVSDYISKLLSCLNAFEYLYSIIQNDTRVEEVLIDGIIHTIDNIIVDKKYRENQYSEAGIPVIKKYKLNKQAKRQLLEKKQQYSNRQSAIHPNTSTPKEENKKKAKQKVIPKNNKLAEILCYIMVVFSVFMIWGSLSYPLVISSLLWLMTAIIFIPEVKKRIQEKWENSKTLILICRIIVPILASLVLTFEMPKPFENVWTSSNGVTITLQDNKAIVQLEDNSVLNGTYTYSLHDSDYKIEVKLTKDNEIKQITFHCVKEENRVTFYFVEKNNEKIYFLPEKPDSSYTYNIGDEDFVAHISKNHADKIEEILPN